MGAGYHGGFGATKGSSKVYKDGYEKSQGQNYTREQLIDFLDGKTAQSSAIANEIRNKGILLSVLGDELFERALGANSDVVAMAIDDKIYLRKNSATIHSDMVHEGTHALDASNGVPYEIISSWDGEIKAYTAEHHFQKASGLAVQFADEEEIKMHVWSNYKWKGRQ